MPAWYSAAGSYSGTDALGMPPLPPPPPPPEAQTAPSGAALASNASRPAAPVRLTHMFVVSAPRAVGAYYDRLREGCKPSPRVVNALNGRGGSSRDPSKGPLRA